jgi:hypothetical protein
MAAAGLMPGKCNKGHKKVIEEEEFKSVLSIAQRFLDVYGIKENAHSPRVTYVSGALNMGYERGVIEIFFQGALVFRHDPKGEITDFYEQRGAWLDEFELLSRNIPRTSSGIANKRQLEDKGSKK